MQTRRGMTFLKHLDQLELETIIVVCEGYET